MSEGMRTALNEAYAELADSEGQHIVIVSYHHPDGSVTNRSWEVTASVSGRIVEILDAWGTPVIEHHMTREEVDEAHAVSERLVTPPLWMDR